MNTHEVSPAFGKITIGVSKDTIAFKQDWEKDAPRGLFHVRVPRRMFLPMLEAIFLELETWELREIKESCEFHEKMAHEKYQDETEA